MSEENKVTGRIKAIYPTQTFDSGAQKVTFIVVNNSGWEGKEKAFAFEMFAGASKVEKIEKFLKFNKEGDSVDVKFEIESRENPKKAGQWFTGLSAWSVFKAEGGTSVDAPPADDDALDQEVPF